MKPNRFKIYGYPRTLKDRKVFAKIFYKRSFSCYVIEFNGKEFYADTFEHAAAELAELLLRDYVVARSKVL